MDDIRALGSTTHLVNLTGIKLEGVDLDDEMLRVLCDGNFPRLNYICLQDMFEWDPMIIANSSIMKQLTHLDLDGCEIPNVLDILRSANAKNLQTFSAFSNQIEEGMDVFLSPNVENLTSLDLEYNYIGNEGAITIANSPYLKNLKKLSLALCMIGDEGAKAIANSPNLSGLNTLYLQENNIVDVTCIEKSKYLTNLTDVHLDNQYMSEDD